MLMNGSCPSAAAQSSARASPFHRPVPACRRGPGRHPGPHARHPHQRRRRLAARLQRRLGRLRGRRQPQGHAAARFVTSRSTRPAVTNAGTCPVCDGQMPRPRPLSRWPQAPVLLRRLQVEGLPGPPAGRRVHGRRAGIASAGHSARPRPRDPAAGQRVGRSSGRHRQRPAGSIRLARSRPRPSRDRRTHAAPADRRARGARHHRDHHETRHAPRGSRIVSLRRHGHHATLTMTGHHSR